MLRNMIQHRVVYINVAMKTAIVRLFSLVRMIGGLNNRFGLRLVFGQDGQLVDEYIEILLIKLKAKQNIP